MEDQRTGNEMEVKGLWKRLRTRRQANKSGKRCKTSSDRRRPVETGGEMEDQRIGGEMED